MIHKAAVVFFLSRMEEFLTSPVALLVGAHLMLFTLDVGPTVVKKCFDYSVDTFPQLFSNRCYVPK